VAADVTSESEVESDNFQRTLHTFTCYCLQSPVIDCIHSSCAVCLLIAHKCLPSNEHLDCTHPISLHLISTEGRVPLSSVDESSEQCELACIQDSHRRLLHRHLVISFFNIEIDIGH